MYSKIALGIVFLGALSATSQLFADTLISTGSVASFAKDLGNLTVLSDKTHAPIQYTGINKATVQYGNGKQATLADVVVGQHITLEYAVVNNTTMVAKIILPDPPAPAVSTTTTPAAGLTTAEQRGATSKAATDNDITTQPGTKARIDGDITTQPGKAALQAPDATKKPAK